MDLKIIESDKDFISFTIFNESAFVTNWLRRILKSEVPTLAVDYVMITQNTSALQDELLVHRLGLVPILSTIADKMIYPDDCDCENGLCKKCSVIFSLDVKSEGESRWVTPSDFKTNNPDVYPIVFPNDQIIKITRLKKGQRIVLKALVRKGNGGIHAKWMPVVTPTMNYENEDVTESGDIKEVKMSFTSVGQIPAPEILAIGLNILKRNIYHLSYITSHET